MVQDLRGEISPPTAFQYPVFGGQGSEVSLIAAVARY